MCQVRDLCMSGLLFERYFTQWVEMKGYNCWRKMDLICSLTNVYIELYLFYEVPFSWAEVVCYLYKSAMLSCMVYCCHVWAGAPSCYFEILVKPQKRVCRTVDPTLATSLEPLAHHCNSASFSLLYRYYFSRFPSELGEFSWEVHSLF